MEETGQDGGKDRAGLFPPRVGERLASAREAQGLTVAQVSERTRIPQRHLEMIESGHHEALPAVPYSAGFVKTYAQLLGLDGAALSRDFRAEIAGVEQTRYIPEPFEPADPSRVPSRALALVALIVAVLLAVAYVLWRGGTGSDERASLAAGTTATPAAAPATAAAVAAAPIAQAKPPAAGGAVVLTAIQPVWIKVFEKDGPTLFMGELPPGQRYDVPATAVDPLVRTGRPQALRITVGSSVIPPLGEPETLVREASLKADSLLARTAPPPPVPAPAATQPAAPPPVTPVDPQTATTNGTNP